jgi:recombination protein RecT
MTEARGAKPGVAARAGTAVEAVKPPPLVTLIERQEHQVERALPSHLKSMAPAMVRNLVTVVRQTPKLAECDPPTVLGGLMLASSLGLQFGPLGHAYLVPFRNTKTGRQEAQFVLGYKGVIDLAWRSEKLRSIGARTVCDADVFSFSYGLDEHLTHEPNLDVTSPPVRWYGVARFVGGGHHFVVLGRAGVDAHRSRSKSRDRGPWVTDFDAMARKSCILEMKPFLPLTTEVAADLQLDGVVADGTTVENLDVNEVDVLDVEAVDDGWDDPDVAVPGAPHEPLLGGGEENR